MHLLKLAIKNFRVIKSTSLDFPDKVIGIVGPNGAGKSSIIEAIAWALYGNVAARSSKDEIRATFAGDSATVEVDLEFEIHGEHYRVVRRLVGRTERPEVILFRGGASESVGSTETQKHIASLIGLDWKGFLTSFLARQQELNALSDLAPGKRREHLAGMLGIDRLDKAILMIKGDTRSSGERATLLGQRLSERDFVLSRVKELSEQLGGLTLEQDRSLGARDVVKIRLTEVEKKFSQAQVDKESCSRLTSKLTAETDHQSMLDQQVARLNREHAEVLRDEESITLLEKSLSGYAENKAQYAREHEAFQTARLYEEIAGQVEKSRAELEPLQPEKGAAENKKRKLESQIGSLPSDLESRSSDMKAELEKERESYSRIRSEREVASTEVKRLTEQLSSIADLGPDTICDRCHRPFGDDLDEIRNHLNSELAQARGSLDRHSEDVARIKLKGEELKGKLTELEQSLKMQQELSGQLGRLENEIKKLTEHEQSAKRNLDDYTDRLSKLELPKSDPAKLEELGKKLEAMESDRRELDRLTGRVSRKDDLVRQQSGVNEKIKQSQSKTDDLRIELDKLGFDPKSFEALRRDHQQVTRDLETKNTALIHATKELELIQNELKLRTEQLDQFGKVEADLNSVRDDHYYGEKLGNLFGEFKKYLIASIRPRLAQISTSLFSEMTADKYGLVELDEDYNLKIMDYGQMFGIDRYSGGEKDLANLCLRLAISIALTESANLDRSFVILDEVFGSQDSTRRDLIFKGMANLKQRFPQVFLITHIGEIRDRVESLIEVNPTSAGWSEVRIDGRSAS